MWPRIFEHTFGSSIAATNLSSLDPHDGQRLMSMPKVRFRRADQLMRVCSGISSSSLGVPCFGFGGFKMTFGRSREFGAKTPEYLNIWNLGGGISAANFSRSSGGSFKPQISSHPSSYYVTNIFCVSSVLQLFIYLVSHI